MATDPVCGLTVDEKSATGSTRHTGQAYYFRSARCLSQFQANPAQFVGTSNPAASAHGHARSETMAAPASPGKAGKAKAKDPICGMLVGKASALKSECAGRAYYFCSIGCQRTFESPEQVGRPLDRGGFLPPRESFVVAGGLAVPVPTHDRGQLPRNTPGLFPGSGFRPCANQWSARRGSGVLVCHQTLGG